MKKLISFLLSLMVCVTISTMSYAQGVKAPKASEVVNEVKDEWIEIQSITLPFELPVTKIATTKGFKFYFTFDGIGDVSISATNYKKYSTKSEYIELVKWQKGNKYKYTTRAKAKANVDLTKLFQK